MPETLNLAQFKTPAETLELLITSQEDPKISKENYANYLNIIYRDIEPKME